MSDFRLDQLRAAQLQHVLAARIRHEVVKRGHTLTSYAKEKGLDYSRFGRMLRGEILMRFEDAASAERNLGLQLIWNLPGVDDDDDSAGPGDRIAK